MKKSLIFLLSALMLGSSVCTVPVQEVSAAGTDNSEQQEHDSKYVYDTQLLMLDPHEENNTMNIIGYYGDEEYLIIPPKIEGFDVVSIGWNAFYNKNIKGIIIPAGVQVIDKGAFMYCRQLEEIFVPSTVCSIGENAFAFCENLESISLPDGISGMGEAAFSYCTKLKEFTFPSGIDYVPDRVLEFNDSLTEINMHNGIKEVNNYAFWHCKSIETINFPQSVKTIGESAIACCDNLKNVTLPSNLKVISSCLAAECPSLEHFNIPETVEKIEGHAFYRCPALKNLKIPAATKEIGDYSVGYDEGVPDWTKKLVDGFVLSGSGNSAAHIYADNNDIPFDIVQDCPYDYETSENNVIITGYHGEPKNIIIPMCIGGKTVTEIAPRAFENSDITGVYIRSNVKTIGEFAFSRSTLLKSVYLCDGIQTIDACAFEGCTSLENVRLPEDMTQWNEYNSGGQFWDCTSLESIVLPKNITGIGPFTFSGCTSLRDIVFPEKLEQIGSNAFAGTAWLNDQPDGGVYIGSILCTFKDNYSQIKELNVREGTRSIAVTAFMNMVDLRSLTLPQGLEGIDLMAFLNCNNLRSITIPETVTYIGDNAFGYYFNEETGNIEKYKDIYICGKPGTAAEKYARENGITFIETGTLINESTISSETAKVNDTVNITAKAIGGTAPYTYAFMYKLNTATSWKVIGTKFGTESTATFKPTQAGTYDVLISVKDSTGKSVAKKFALTVTAPVVYASKSTINATDVTCGTKIILTGAAEGGTEPYYYTYQYQKPGKTSWITLGEKYGTAESENFTPKVAGTYKARVLVKDSKGTVKSSVFTVNVTGELLVNKSTISAAEVTTGTKVTITTATTGGTEPFYYTYEYKAPSASKWTTIGKRNSANTTASFTPTSTGTYEARVYIKDAGGFVTVKNFKVTVK